VIGRHPYRGQIAHIALVIEGHFQLRRAPPHEGADVGQVAGDRADDNGMRQHGQPGHAGQVVLAH
jgi:hypothetical protein